MLPGIIVLNRKKAICQFWSNRANKKALTEVTSVLVSIDGRRHSVQTAIDIYCESLRRAVELKDVDQLLLPDIIGLECETYEEKRAKGKV